MTTTIYILVLLSALSFPILTGIAEAWWYHIRMMILSKWINWALTNITYPPEPKEKLLLTLIRIAFYLPVIAHLGWLVGIGLMLQFMLLHDGMYYVTRNNIDPAIYPKRFWDFGNSNPKGIDAKVWLRVLASVVGIGLIVWGVLR